MFRREMVKALVRNGSPINGVIYDYLPSIDRQKIATKYVS